MTVGLNFIALPNELGSGALRYIKMLFKAMSFYNIEDCSFIVYKQKQISEEYIGLPKNLKVKYVDVPQLGMGMKRVLFEQTLFYKYLEPCDVLYSYCTSMPLLARCRKIFTLHDVYFLTTKERYGWLQRNYLSMITKLYCKFCDKILTVSKFSYNEISNLLGVPEEKLALTYNFIIKDSSYVVKRPDSLTDVTGANVDLDIPYFFYVGNLQPGKNIKGMIDGFLKYSDGRNGIQLIIAGKPTTYGNLMVEYVKNHKNIHYVGYQSRDNVEYLLANCLAVTLLSFCEGFGIPPIEGFSYGRPALTSNTTSLPEVVGKAGYSVAPHDINAIADGFKTIEDKHDDYLQYIPEQLAKFDAFKSVETFMDTLGIKYSRI